MNKKSLITVPNILTSIRLIGAIALIFIPFKDATNIVFYIVYTVAGVTDLFDGMIARRTGSVSKFGSILDSIADVSIYAVMIARVFRTLIEKLVWWVWVLAGIAVAIRAACYIVYYAKFKGFASTHFFLNKASGVSIFLIPYALAVDHFVKNNFFVYYALFISVLAMAAAAIELVSHIRRKEAPN